MAVTYFDILADVMNQMNSLLSTTVSELDTAYGNVQGGALSPGERTSTDWPVEMMKQAILDAEFELCKEICFNTKHPERTQYLKASNAIFHQDGLPTVSQDGTPYIGQIDTVRQTTTGFLMTPRPQTVVEWAFRNANNAYRSPANPLVYCINGGIMLHNAFDPATVVITQPALARGIFGLTQIQCKEYHRSALVAGAMVKLLTKEGAYADAMNLNAGLWSAAIEQIRSVGAQIGEATPSQF